jgi:hypothetical protein
MNILHFIPRFLLRERYRFSPGSGRKESIFSVFRSPYAAKFMATHLSRCGENAVWVRKGLWLARQPRPNPDHSSGSCAGLKGRLGCVVDLDFRVRV